MLYVILGLILVVTISAFVRRKEPTEPDEVVEQPQKIAERPSPVAVDVVLPEEIAPPITSPSISASALYSSAGDIFHTQKNIKKDAYGLHWCNRTGELNIGDFSLRGPMIYWSDGEPGITEPSCVDITLPFEFPNTEKSAFESAGADTYASMTPLQRGAYLLWLAGGRAIVPSHISLPTVWFYGVERRVLIDRQDVAFCVFEVMRMLPLMRVEALRNLMERFVIWVSINSVMPEEQILRHIMALDKIPVELFGIMLANYSNAKLPLPSNIAYIIMRSSPLAERGGEVPYSQELVHEFSAIYKSRTNGGLVLTEPRAKISVAYVAANESIPIEKRKQEILDIPDFFKDPAQFNPIIDVWNEFTQKLESREIESATPAERPLEQRRDWEAYIEDKLDGAPPPLIVPLSEIAGLLELDTSEKPTGAERKEMSDTARVEGYLIAPELCVSGKEYAWDDDVALLPISMGEKISDSYNCAALAFEYAAALRSKDEKNSEEDLSDLLQLVIEHFSLNNDEIARLGVLPKIFASKIPDADNIGGCLELWLSQEQREFVKEFFEFESVETGEKFTEMLGDLFKNK